MRRRVRSGLAVGVFLFCGACADASAPGVGSAPTTSESAPGPGSSGAAASPAATSAAPSAWAFPPDPPSTAQAAALQEALRQIQPGRGPPIQKHLLPHERTVPGSPIDRLPARPCDPSFCVRAIEDDVDHLRAVFAEHAPPADMQLAHEDVLAGVGLPRGVWFLIANAPSPHALQEVAALASAALPPGRELAWGPAAGDAPAGALRSYVVGPAIVDAADLASASKTADGVELVLRPAGKARFAEATALLTRRRIALLTAGRVVSAPLLMTPIPGGKLTLGVGSEEADRLLQTIAPR